MDGRSQRHHSTVKGYHNICPGKLSGMVVGEIEIMFDCVKKVLIFLSFNDSSIRK